MSVEPFTSSRFRALDSNGAPLTGGKLYTYSAGTTSLLSSYTDRGGLTANANPVILDSQGYADVWMTSGVNYKFVLQDSSGAVQWTVDNFPPPADSSTAVSTSAASIVAGGRLSLTTGVPVTTSDVTGATTIYYLPYKTDQVPLYDGANWTANSIGASGLSQLTTDNTKSPAAVANNSNYDLFVWSDAGTLRLSRGPAWTSDTARGTGVGTTELVQTNGHYLNKNAITNGPSASTGLYVGTVRSDGSAQINDSQAKRHVWNMNNRVRRSMLVRPGGTWTYTGTTLRQANAATTNQLDMVLGLSEDVVNAKVRVVGQQATAATSGGGVAIGLDGVNVAADCVAALCGFAVVAQNMPLSADYAGLPGLGRHYLAWGESGGGTNATTFNSDGASNKGGIQGELLA